MSTQNVKLSEAEVQSLIAERDALQLKLSMHNGARVAERRNTFSVSLSEFVQATDGNGKGKVDATGKPVMKPGKGGFKVTGLGNRFPVTLYPEQWEILFANSEAIRACYNDPTNKAKSDKLRDDK